KIKTSGYINITEANFAFGIGDRYRGYNAYGIQTINGLLYNPYVSLGLGVGIFLDMKEEVAFIPLFADLRVYLLKQKPVIPFLSIDVGYALCRENNNKGGALINPSLGMKAYASSKVAINFSLGYMIQYDTRNVLYYNNVYVSETVEIGRLNFKVGISF